MVLASVFSWCSSSRTTLDFNGQEHVATGSNREEIAEAVDYCVEFPHVLQVHGNQREAAECPPLAIVFLCKLTI